MVETVYQCCYTNAQSNNAGMVTSGWQAVSVSKDIPSDAYNTCVNLQAVNSTIQGSMTDECGNVLDLYEISGDQNYVYVMRSKYGMLDRLGRANMFSHAYIFPWSESGALRDPNVFLTIGNSNFTRTQESADQQMGHLSRTEGFTLDAALASLDIDDKEYLILIQCVFAQITERSISGPLYIGYDGDEAHMRAILYCIYMGLPFFLRKRLSIASSETVNTTGKNIIFTINTTARDYYVVPSTGENNVINKRMERRLARYGFADYAIRNRRSLDTQKYFEQLEQVAADLGDTSASDVLILKLAHQFITDPDIAQLSDDALDERLNDALRSRTEGSVTMENYIARILDEMVVRRHDLTDECEANLNARLSDAVTPRLADAGERYAIVRFEKLPEDQAAAKLSQMGGKFLSRYLQLLSQTERGRSIIDLYYANYRLPFEGMTWESLNQTVDELNAWSDVPKSLNLAQTRCWELYESLLEPPSEAAIAARNYQATMAKLVSAGELAVCERNAREAFWNHLSFQNFSYRDNGLYREMWIEAPRSCMFLEMFSLRKELNEGSTDEFFKDARAFLAKYRTSLSDDELNEAYETIEETLVQYGPTTSFSITEWLSIISSADNDLLVNPLLKLRRQLDEGTYLQICDAYQDARLSPGWSGSNTSTRVAQLILNACFEMDLQAGPVPLDLWLLCGSDLYENPFQVFDDQQQLPMVIEADSFSVVKESILLRDDPAVIDAANQYVRSRGREAATVKTWIKFRERAVRTGRKHGVGGPFRLWFSGGRHDSSAEGRRSGRRR